MDARKPGDEVQIRRILSIILQFLREYTAGKYEAEERGKAL